MSLFAAQVYPGQALGFLVLGATLHDVLTRLKSEPQRFPKLDIFYEPTAPVKDPVLLSLPANGIRLRFDGPQQLLRLIEVLDFTKNKLTYKDRDVFRASTSVTTVPSTSEEQAGPMFRHIYKNLIGPTFPGEYIEPEAEDETGMGLYVLSYPGVAFSFPLHKSTWSPKKEFVSLLTASTYPAASMAIYSGDSWADAREHLYTQGLEPVKSFAPLTKGREPVPDEVELVRIYGEGRLELVRPTSSAPFWLQLGETTPQELVAELGPPDAIYRKHDQRMAIHKDRTTSGTHTRPDLHEFRSDDSTDTDQSSAHTATDDSDEDEDGEAAGSVSGECFYNYFYRGFDILISTPTVPSQRPPSKANIHPRDVSDNIADSSRLVASKLVLHGNVPGSYPFNRHRRCRWEIQYLDDNSQDLVDSETPFKEIEYRLHEEWKSIYKDAEEAKSRQRGMVLNRDWGDSPGSSVELLGGWEDSAGGKRSNPADSTKGLGNTTLFGFPGLVFEVLKNGTVSGVTVF